MVELLYGLYKKQTIEQIMYTFISSVVIYGYGSFENEKLIVDSNEFPKRISKILCGIDLKNSNSIKWKDVVDLKDYFIQLLGKHGYVSKIPLIGYIRSRRFHRTMKVERLSINEYIRLYIDKEDKNYLDDIDPRIKGISFSFPRYDGF